MAKTKFIPDFAAENRNKERLSIARTERHQKPEGKKAGIFGQKIEISRSHDSGPESVLAFKLACPSNEASNQGRLSRQPCKKWHITRGPDNSIPANGFLTRLGRRQP
jgi:hypothetical protein